MQVNIRSEQKLNYETPGACAFDFKANQDYSIPAGEVCMIETGTAIDTPEWYMLMLAPRSSTYKKKGLILVNSVGILDNDYCGDEDTAKFMYLNMTKETVQIEKWDRIGQGIFVKIAKADFQYVESLGNKNRGWFGTTGIS